MRGKDDQRVALTKRLLREGLLRLLETKELGRVSVTELCAESGINRATFYRHYSQPRDIVAELRREMFDDMERLAQRIAPEEDPRLWLTEMCRYFYDRAELLRLIFRCRTDDEFVSLIDGFCQKRLQPSRQRVSAEPTDEGELRLSAYCLAGGIYYTLRQWITEPIDKTPEEVAKVIHRLLA